MTTNGIIIIILGILCLKALDIWLISIIIKQIISAFNRPPSIDDDILQAQEELEERIINIENAILNKEQGQ